MSDESRKLRIKVKQNPNPRVHKILFDPEANFKPKRVKLKNTYNRKPKHKKDIEHESH